MKKVSSTRRNRVARELRKQIICLSDQEILSIGSGRNAFSLFYEVGDIHFDSYFSRDYPDGAAEAYWRQFGMRQGIVLDLDDDLLELPEELTDELTFLSEEKETRFIKHLIPILVQGLSVKAQQLRDLYLQTAEHAIKTACSLAEDVMASE